MRDIAKVWGDQVLEMVRVMRNEITFMHDGFERVHTHPRQRWLLDTTRKIHVAFILRAHFIRIYSV